MISGQIQIQAFDFKMIPFLQSFAFRGYMLYKSGGADKAYKEKLYNTIDEIITAHNNAV